MWTGIPVFKLTEAETKKLIRMEEELHKRVIGQEVAITAVSKAIRRSRAGIKDPKRPAGSFIFLGPSGVGKTELARTLADFLFGDEEAMVRIDMSEYMEKHAVSRLVGSPPGYIGYDEGGQLTEAVRRKPYSVLLLDEIEKAHPDVFNILLQILEDGRLTDAQGRTVDFRNAIVIMTSNIGAAEISKNTSIGFTVSDDETGMSYDDMKNRIMGDLKKVFRPEFLNRIDEVIVFHKLAKEEVKEIIDLMINRVRVQVAEHELQLELTDEAKDLPGRQRLGPVDGRPPVAPGDPALHRGPAGRRSPAARADDPRLDRDVHPRRLRRRGRQAAAAGDHPAEQPESPLDEAEPAEGRRRRQEGRGRRRPRPDGRPTRATATPSPEPSTQRMREPGRSAIGTWSGGRFLHFGEAIEEDRLAALLRPGEGIDTVLTADAYGTGEADRVLGRALAGVARDELLAGRRRRPRLLRGRAQRAEGLPALHRPAPARPRRLRLLPADGDRGAASSGSAPRDFDVLLLHNPDRIGYSCEVVWDGMAALRDAGLTAKIGVAPGPANGFTLDLISCLERFGDRIDWAMIILNPLEPWPGELLPRRRRPPRRQGDHPRGRLRRPLLGRPAPRHGAGADRPPLLPPRGLDRGRAREAGAAACPSPSAPG